MNLRSRTRQWTQRLPAVTPRAWSLRFRHGSRRQAVVSHLGRSEKIMRQFIPSLFLALSISTAIAYEGYPEMPSMSKTPEQHAKIVEIRATMDDFVISRLDLRNKSLGDAVQSLYQYVSAAGGRFSFILRSPSTAGTEESQFSLQVLTDVSLPKALNMICDEFGMRWSCEGKIFIYPETNNK